MLDARRAALAGLIDHAPLFPPAALPPVEAAAAFAAARSHRHGWMVARLAWPTATLGALVTLLPETVTADDPWPITALLGEPVDAAALPSTGPVRVEQVEVRLVTDDDPARLDEALAEAGVTVRRVFEVALDGDWAVALERIAAARASVKIRTGGIDPGAVPSAPVLAAFVHRSVELGVPFKATAGLHHPFAHGDGPDFQHGFVAVLAGVAAARAGHAPDVVAAALTDEPASFGLTDDGMRWRDLWVDADEVTQLRSAAFLGFGSCSFEEPVEDLEALGWLK